jgi:hypothetical protein
MVAEEQRKSATLRFRATEALREQVEQAAGNSGLTLSEELERRLADSFKFELVLHTMFSDEQTKAFFINLAALVHTVRKHSNEQGTLSDTSKWFEHDPTRAGLRAGIDVLLEYFIPKARQPNPAPSSPAEVRQERFYAVELENMEEFGKEFTEMMMSKLSGEAASLNLDGPPEH